jgi:hypothetical protein
MAGESCLFSLSVISSPQLRTELQSLSAPCCAIPTTEACVRHRRRCEKIRSDLDRGQSPGVFILAHHVNATAFAVNLYGTNGSLSDGKEIYSQWPSTTLTVL